mmetsp:Transcript_18002/g.34395  ORF Transcript_18002/g.34395 Transcript_18002/m.34395 type:complete len:231 (+) Transcript_18002:1648-2340(+)
MVREKAHEGFVFEKHALLQDLEVGARLLQEIEFGQHEVAHPAHRLDAQPLELGLHVLQRRRLVHQRVPRAELELVLQSHQILQVGLVHLGVQDVRHQGGGHRDFLDKRAQLRLRQLAVVELHRHAQRLLLQGLDLGADVAQVRLKSPQQLLHGPKDVVAHAHLLVQVHEVVALLNVVLDRVQLHRPKARVHLAHMLAHVRALTENAPHHLVVPPQLQLLHQPVQLHLLAR